MLSIRFLRICSSELYRSAEWRRSSSQRVEHPSTNGSYSRLQFLRAVRHSVSAHTDTLQPRNDSSSSSEDDDEDDVSQAPVPPATTSAASESAAVPVVAATYDDSWFLRCFAVSMRLKWIDFCNSNIHRVPEKTSHFNFRHNFAICWDIFTIFEAFCSGIIHAWQSIAHIRKGLFMW